MDTISNDTLDNLEQAANTPLVSHNQWLSSDAADNICATHADAKFLEMASPKNISMLINRLRIAEGKLQAFEELEAPVLLGNWHHGHGCVVSGTVRIASSDFDTCPTKEFQNDFWDWTCKAMNKLLEFKKHQKEEEE